MTDQSPSEAEVIEWLREHPDFLSNQPELFAQLEIPHEAGAASLIEKQVELLRSDNQRLKRQLKHLSGVAGENERLMQRLHRMALDLVAAESFDALYQRLHEGLGRDFRADAVCLLLDREQREKFTEADVVALPENRPEWLEKLMVSGKPQCGRLTREKREAVFGKSGAELGSAALVPLAESGLLAIGANSDDRFHPDMGTLFLELLRETLQFRLGMQNSEEGNRRQRA